MIDAVGSGLREGRRAKAVFSGVANRVIVEPELRLPGLDPLPIDDLADAFNRTVVPDPEGSS